jgi:hypothetical protein
MHTNLVDDILKAFHRKAELHKKEVRCTRSLI